MLSSTDEKPTTGHNSNETPFTAEYLNGKSKFESFNGGLWAFVASGTGVKVLNKLTGKYINTACKLDANGAAFIAKKNGNGFSLQVPNQNIQHIGDHDGNHLGVWNEAASATDGGSRWTVAEANVADIVNIGKATIDATEGLDNTVDENNCAQVKTAARLSVAKAAAAKATTLAELDNAYALFANMPCLEAGAYYRIKNCNLTDAQKAYLTTENMFVGTDGSLKTAYNTYGDYDKNNKPNGVDRKIRRSTASGNFVSQLWKFEANEDGNTYMVRNANTDCLFCEYKAGDLDMPVNKTAGGAVSFKTVPAATFSGNDGKTMFQMNVNGHTLNAWSGDYDNVVQAYDGHDDDKGNYWQFIKVTEIPVAISEAAGWASVALPCPVQAPAEADAVAYYATKADGDYMTLTSIAAGEVIPAGAGFLLAKQGGGTVNLAISSEAGTTNADNKLQGVTAKRKGYTAGENYVLALNSNNEAAFLLSKLETVPANKAFLPAAVATNAAGVLSFAFNGTETGIGQASDAAQPAHTTFYDLNGRVVLYPTHGVYVTDKGQKVYIK